MVPLMEIDALALMECEANPSDKRLMPFTTKEVVQYKPDYLSI